MSASAWTPVDESVSAWKPVAETTPEQKAVDIDDPEDPHSVKQALPREVISLGKTLEGIPSGLFHAFKDEATPEEAQMLKEKGLDPTSALDRAGLRLVKEPVASAYHFWKNYATQSEDQKIRAQSDILDVAPEAMGQGAAGPIAGKLTEMLPRAIPESVEFAKRGALLGRTPAEAYQSALKPSIATNPLKVDRAIQTGLQEGIPVSKAGVEKLQFLIDDVNHKLADEIQSDPTRPISKAAVADRLANTADKFKTQVNPEADLQAIADSKAEFLRNQPDNIPAEQAQALKTGTYRQLSSKAYGEMKSASIEAQKALARGLKEELADAFPELKSLNARDSELFNLQPLLEKAVQRQANHQLGGIGSPIAAGATKAVTGSSGLAATAGLLKLIVDNPAIKSRLAIALNRAGVSLPSATSRIAAYSEQLAGGASAASTAIHDDRSSE